jgi:hypothetical protein
MGKRQRVWAKKARLNLRRELGMKCAGCGSRDYRKLEFDLIKPELVKNPAFHHRQMEFSWRISFYRQQSKIKNVQLLCGGSAGSCHNKKTFKENYT